MNSNIGKNVDRISQLPDALLCHILSFLSTKYAVGTSVLSQRWRNLWHSVPNLVLDEYERFQPDNSVDYMSSLWPIDKTNTFTDFVDRVLLVNDAPYLQTFSLSFGSFPAMDKYENWISAALARNVRELKLSHYDRDGIYAPNVLFTSETLVVLELSFAMIQGLDSAWLPRLKVLILERAEYDSAESLQKLFSGCPALEDLHIMRCMCQEGALQDLNVSVPTLRRLIVGCDDGTDLYDEEETDYYNLVIDTPQLEHLDLTDFVSHKFLFNNLPSLSKASIRVGPNITKPDSSTDLGRISQILSQLSTVKSLDANLQTKLKYCELPTFPNLTHLKLGGNHNNCWNLKLLGDFLNCSPNLEVLTVEGGRPNSWKKPKEVPICLSLRLKSIEILRCTGKDYELSMIRYLLEKGEVLKKMTIHCKCSNGHFYTSLAGFPRSSKNCELSLRL